MTDSSPSLRVSHSPSLVFPLAGAAVAVALGWASAMLHIAGKSPIGLMSLGLGVVLGLLLVALAQMTTRPSRRGLLASAVLCALLTVFAEHGWLYYAYRQKWRENRVEQPAVALFRPDDAPLSIAGYFQRELSYAPRQWTFWLVDASLIIAGTVGVVVLRNRSANSTAASPDADIDDTANLD